MSDIWLPPNELIPELMLSVAQLSEDRDWGHGPLQLQECHQLTKGEGVKIAVLDTGVDFEHPDLKDRIVLAKDFTGSRTGASDVQGHGSHCAGIAVASANESGIVGTAPAASLLVGKVLADNGSGSSAGIAAGIRWAVASGANVISMSFGGSTRDRSTTQALAEAVQAGVYPIAAFGNEGPNPNTGGEPGKDPSVLGVGAVDSNLRVANFSSRGRELDVAAPGVSVRSCYPGSRYAVLSGTSMATPYVAGCVALYLAYLKKLGLAWPRFDVLYELIKQTAKDLGTSGFDTHYGWGLIQPLAMIRTVAVPPSPPDVPPPVPGKGQIVLEVDWAFRQVKVSVVS